MLMPTRHRKKKSPFRVRSENIKLYIILPGFLTPPNNLTSVLLKETMLAGFNGTADNIVVQHLKWTV